MIPLYPVGLAAMFALGLVSSCSAPAVKPAPSPTPSAPRVVTAMLLALGPELIEFWCYTDGTVWATRIVDGRAEGEPQELPREVSVCEVVR